MRLAPFFRLPVAIRIPATPILLHKTQKLPVCWIRTGTNCYRQSFSSNSAFAIKPCLVCSIFHPTIHTIP